MEPDQGEELFNIDFWPAVTDLMVSVVLLLILVMAVFKVAQGAVDLRSVRARQAILPKMLKIEGFEIAFEGRDRVDLRVHPGEKPAIVLATDPNNPLLRRITFSQDALFAPDQEDLAAPGRDVLQRMGRAILHELETNQSDIVQIQIHGHADNTRSSKFRDNLELAARRADAVYRSLYERGLSPIKYMMSATSFGEFCPVTRMAGEPFLPENLSWANNSDDKRQLNRRIELLLFYRRPITRAGFAP